MLGIIRDSLKITAILNCKQQRRAAAYRDLEAEGASGSQTMENSQTERSDGGTSAEAVTGR